MPQWLVITLIVLMVLVVLGFFGLMFAEMGNKRTTGRFTASTPNRAGKGTGGRAKSRPRKSR
jgi:flagellar basal body-associated protein FliL|tara:strand:+ start:917 stop:1102 length:186 start_codon:yes stop_codon:yes gene_type:complete